ncbi:DNA-binding protein [Azonexus hydrophilus]|uniref:DNA-binding protein n=1 Tax=Azonexus hydrophilus TaxID=418702 RepID=A0ABZ2XMQ5_9RHOO
MARPSSVNYESVSQAIIDEMAEGGRITFDNIYGRLGRRGSASVVQEMMSRFVMETGQSLKDARQAGDTLNPSVVRALLTAAEGIMAASVEHAENRVLTEKSVFERQAAELEDAKSALIAENKLLAAEVQELQNLVALREAEKQGMENRHNDLLSRTAQLEQEVATLSDTYQNLREDHVVAVQSIANLQTAHAGELARIHADHEENVASIRQTLIAERNRDAEIAAGERKHLMMQTDQIRQSMSQDIARLSSDAELYKTKYTSVFEQLQQKSLRLSVEETRSTALATELAELREDYRTLLNSMLKKENQEDDNTPPPAQTA